jgi:hypothetical protein
MKKVNSSLLIGLVALIIASTILGLGSSLLNEQEWFDEWQAKKFLKNYDAEELTVFQNVHIFERRAGVGKSYHVVTYTANDSYNSMLDSSFRISFDFKGGDTILRYTTKSDSLKLCQFLSVPINEYSNAADIYGKRMLNAMKEFGLVEVMGVPDGKYVKASLSHINTLIYFPQGAKPKRSDSANFKCWRFLSKNAYLINPNYVRQK